ncbi:hypothetical protein BJF83_23225 [Nocardiopsis sp. CNR-923]|uniref:hypothetical protein n=1 Tax=Nocardiopsis sp. CNR-923 TaxID=1904965 RepID=UPI00095ED178|nr:hypothetical protein [Nocardiopsis sp. CNR-923]OLT25316.1 hypothetical protein BJF83_23225 [Nocardiopsis sp. CNR-923]
MDRPDGHDVTEANKPEGEDEAQDSAAAPPSDLALQADWSSLLGRVFATWARRLWGLLVVTAVPVLPVTLLGQALMVAPARDGVYLNGALESAVDPLAPSNLVAAGVLVVLALAAAPIAVGGSALLGAAALLGRRISPRQAWQGARRRYFAVLTWILLLIGLVGGFAALFLWALTSDWPPVVTGLALLVVLILVLTPVTVSLPLALVEGLGPFRAVLEACRLARQRFGTHLMLVCLSYGVTLLAGTGLEWALVRWTDLVDGNPVLTATTVLTGLLVAPLSLLLACAPVAYCGTVNTANPFATPPPARYDERGRLVSMPREARIRGPGTRA